MRGVKRPPSWHIALAHIFDELTDERLRQEEKFGEQNHRDGTGADASLFGVRADVLAEDMRRVCQRAAEAGGCFWTAILLEEVFEAFAEDDPAKLRAELMQVAAVAINWIQAIDRRA